MPEVTNKIIYLLDATQANAEAAKLSSNIDGIGKAAQTTAVGVETAGASIAGSAKNAQFSMDSLKKVLEGVAKTQGENSAAYKELSAAMNANTTASRSSASTAQSTAAANKANAEAARERAAAEKEIAGVAANQTAARKEAVSEMNNYWAAQIKALDSTKRADEVQVKNNKTTEEGGEKVSLFTRLLTTNTSQISTAGGVLQGYDAGLQAVVRSIGGVSIVTALAISLGAQLIGKLFEQTKAGNDLKDVSNDLIKTDIFLADAFQKLAQAAGFTNEALNKQAQAFHELIAIDVAERATSFGVALAEFEKQADKSRTATARFNEAQRIYNELSDANAKATKISADGIDGAAIAIAQAQARMEEANKAINESNSLRDAEEKKIKSAVEALIVYKDLTNKTTDEVLAEAAAHQVNANVLARLKIELDKATDSTYQLAKAREALKNIPPPSWDLKNTNEGLKQLFGTAQAGAKDSKKQFADLDQQVLANQKNLKPLMDAAKENSKIALAAQGITEKTLGTEKYKAALREQEIKTLKTVGEAYGHQGRVVLEQIGILNKSTETQDKHTKSSAAGENATIRFTRALEQANAALEEDSFEKRRKAIDADINAQEKEVARMKTTAAKKAEITGILEETREARRQKVLIDELAAENRFEEQLQAIKDAGLELSEERHRQAAEREVERRANDLKKEFGDNESTAIKIARMREAVLDKEHREMVDRREKLAEKIGSIDDRMMEETLKRDAAIVEQDYKLWVDNEERKAKKFQEQLEVFNELTLQFAKRAPGGAIISLPSAGEVQPLVEALKKVGMTVSDVDQKFGNASKNSAIFEARLRFLTELAPKANTEFQKMTMEVYLLAQQMANSKTKAQEMFELLVNMADAFTSSFTAAFHAVLSEQQNFFKAFLAAFVSGMATAIGQWMVQHGTMLVIKGISDILMGIAFLNNPFLAFWGPGLIAAGAAEVAQGTAWAAAGAAVMAAGSFVAGKLTPKKETAAGGGAAAGATPTESAPRPPAPPTVIPFPTSGSASQRPGGSMTILQLDRSGTRDFLKGEKVVTMDGARGSQNRELKRAIG